VERFPDRAGDRFHRDVAAGGSAVSAARFFGGGWVVPISPVRLNHAVLMVGDLDRAVRFYTGVLGMEVVARWSGVRTAGRVGPVGPDTEEAVPSEPGPAGARRYGLSS